MTLLDLAPTLLAAAGIDPDHKDALHTLTLTLTLTLTVTVTVTVTLTPTPTVTVTLTNPSTFLRL